LLDASLAWTPANFGRKSSFLVSYNANPSCIPNLKLLASVVAEINRGYRMFGGSLSLDPLILIQKVVFDKLIFVPELHRKFVAHVHL